MVKSATRTDWKTQELAAARGTIPVNRPFSESEMVRIRHGLIPEQMEDKWFVFWESDALHFHRSWTGYCNYIVHFTGGTEGWRMVSAEVNRDPQQFSMCSDGTDQKMISFLIDVLLLKKDAEFPSEDPLKVWGQVGRAMLGDHPGDSPAGPAVRPASTE